MNTKELIYRSDNQYETTLYQEISSGNSNVSTATLCINNPTKFSISVSDNNNPNAMGHLTVEIPVSVLDEMKAPREFGGSSWTRMGFARCCL